MTEKLLEKLGFTHDVAVFWKSPTGQSYAITSDVTPPKLMKMIYERGVHDCQKTIQKGLGL
jgi:hypothetical protein